MRFLVLFIGIFALLTLPAASSLADAAGTPTRAPLRNSYSTFDLPAGQACSFELAGKPVVNHEYALTFPADANGDVRQRVSGRLLERLTNVSIGKSLVVDISGPGRFIYHADGSVAWDLSGRWLYFSSPTDTPAGPSAYVNSGRIVADLTAAGRKTLVSRSGTRSDVCAALS